MMVIFFNFLKNHLLSAIGGALILGIAAKLSIQKVELTHLHNQVAVCSAENSSLQNFNHLLIISVQKQNAAIAGLQQESDKNKCQKICIGRTAY